MLLLHLITHKNTKLVGYPWISDRKVALTTDRNPFPLMYSNLQSKQESGRNTTP